MLATIGHNRLRRARRRIFRDVNQLAYTPDLQATIEEALEQSRFLVVIASEESLDSEWVQREISWWLIHHTRSTLLVLDVEHAPDDRSWLAATSLAGLDPAQVFHAYRPEPGRRRKRLQNLQAAGLGIAALLDGRPLAELREQCARLGRRAQLARSTLLTLLAVRAAVSVVAAQLTVAAARSAQADARRANADRLAQVAEVIQPNEPRLAAVMAASAYQMHPSNVTELALSNARSVESQRPARRWFQTGSAPVTAVASNGTTIVAGNENGMLFAWDVDSPERERDELTVSTSPIVGLVAINTGLVSVSADGHVVLLSAGGGLRSVHEVALAGCVPTTAMANPAGSVVVVGCTSGSLVFVQPSDGTNAPLTFTPGSLGPVGAVGFDLSGGWLVAASGNRVVGWRAAPVGDQPVTPTWQTTLTPRHLVDQVTSLDIADGRIAVGGTDGYVRLLDLQTGAEVATPLTVIGSGHGAGAAVLVRWLTLSPGRLELLSVGPDHLLHQWDNETAASPGPGLNIGVTGLPLTMAPLRGGLVVGESGGEVVWLQPSTSDDGSQRLFASLPPGLTGKVA